MSSEQVQLERRAAQRFDVHLPLSVHLAGGEREGCGFTQNLCARGALFHTDLALSEADPIELTLVMPSEITLAENMRVRCPARCCAYSRLRWATDPWLRFSWQDTNSCRKPSVDR